MIVPPGKSLVLFDAACHLCSGWVQLLLKADRKARFVFAPLGGATAAKLDQTKAISGSVDSIVLIEGECVAIYSDAILQIAQRMGGFYQLLAVGYILPKTWRDGLYHIVARNRFAWFGRRSACLVPDEKYRSRFLD